MRAATPMMNMPMATYAFATNHFAIRNVPRRMGCINMVRRVPFSASPAMV